MLVKTSMEIERRALKISMGIDNLMEPNFPFVAKICDAGDTAGVYPLRWISELL